MSPEPQLWAHTSIPSVLVEMELLLKFTCSSTGRYCWRQIDFKEGMKPIEIIKWEWKHPGRLLLPSPQNPIGHSCANEAYKSHIAETRISQKLILVFATKHCTNATSKNIKVDKLCTAWIAISHHRLPQLCHCVVADVQLPQAAPGKGGGVIAPAPHQDILQYLNLGRQDMHKEQQMLYGTNSRQFTLQIPHMEQKWQTNNYIIQLHVHVHVCSILGHKLGLASTCVYPMY